MNKSALTVIYLFMFTSSEFFCLSMSLIVPVLRNLFLKWDCQKWAKGISMNSKKESELDLWLSNLATDKLQVCVSPLLVLYWWGKMTGLLFINWLELGQAVLCLHTKAFFSKNQKIKLNQTAASKFSMFAVLSARKIFICVLFTVLPWLWFLQHYCGSYIHIKQSHIFISGTSCILLVLFSLWKSLESFCAIKKRLREKERDCEACQVTVWLG